MFGISKGKSALLLFVLSTILIIATLSCRARFDESQVKAQSLDPVKLLFEYRGFDGHDQKVVEFAGIGSERIDLEAGGVTKSIIIGRLREYEGKRTMSFTINDGEGAFLAFYHLDADHSPNEHECFEIDIRGQGASGGFQKVAIGVPIEDRRGRLKPGSCPRF